MLAHAHFNLAGLAVHFELLADLQIWSVRLAVQANDTLHYTGERFGNLDVRSIGHEFLVIETVGVHLGGERLFDLADRSAEHYETPAPRDFADGHALLLEPLLHFQ